MPGPLMMSINRGTRCFIAATIPLKGTQETKSARATAALKMARLRFVIAWLCLAPALPAFAYEQYFYLETRGEESHVYRWTRRLDDEVVQITTEEPGKLHLSRCTPEGATLAWSVKEGSTQVEARRHGNAIELRGRRADERFVKRLIIGDEPWYQALSYSLREFAADATGPARFWMLRPDTFEPVKLKAERAGQERIDTKSGPRLAEKVRVSTTGLLSGLWEAHYWFDGATGVFLRFEGGTKLPGSPKTVIQRLD